jgi:hypothetical protein
VAFGVAARKSCGVGLGQPYRDKSLSTYFENEPPNGTWARRLSVADSRASGPSTDYPFFE